MKNITHTFNEVDLEDLLIDFEISDITESYSGALGIQRKLSKLNPDEYYVKRVSYITKIE